VSEVYGVAGGSSTILHDPLWYKDAVIYQVHVKAFRDGNGDGVGDFRGFVEKLSYLEDLGVNAIWVLPFYPSPLRDDGYDIADYTGVHPDYGTLQDFRLFLRAAHSRGMRVITELVLNHTSDQHEWFRRARSEGPGGKYRDYYVWNDNPNRYAEARIIFKDFEASNWSWDPVAKAYYWHRFYSHQPDLNYDNPAVRKEMFRVLDFWASIGVDGFRLDAVPYLFERDGTNCENLPETYEYLRRIRAHVDRRYKYRMLLAEANQWPEDAVAYFGEGDICHMAFHFPLMPRMYIALQMEDRFPIIDILDQTPRIPETSQWAVFLRNHDELTLEMVTDEERDYMYRVYAKDTRARINLGIRRRLAPLLSNDRKKIELMNILLFSMPGTPVLYYGDEIGMGDNYYLGDRNGVRTPMQWSSDRNAGFSDANPQKLYLPAIIDPEYHYETLNVETQERNTASLLWWMKRVIGIRKSVPAFGRGELRFLYPTNPAVLAFVRKYDNRDILVAANLSRFSQAAEIDLSEYAGSVPEEIFSNNRFPPIRKTPYILTFGPYDYFWFVLQPEKTEIQIPGERPLPTMELAGGWHSLFEPDSKRLLESSILPQYLRRCRWFGEKSLPIQRLSIVHALPVPLAGDTAYILVLELVYRQGAAARYVLPVAFASGAQLDEPDTGRGPAAIVRLVTKEQSGVLIDAVYDERFSRALLTIVAGGRRVRGNSLRLGVRRSRRFRSLLDERGLELPVQRARVEQSNSSIMFGGTLFMKLYRRLDEGRNPEIEILQFLTDRTEFSNIPVYAGELTLETASGSSALCLLQGFVTSQGDAWNWALGQLNNFFDLLLTERPDFTPLEALSGLQLYEVTPEAIPPVMHDLMGEFFLEMMELLGRRTGELHRALASGEDNPEFAPEPFSTLYQRSLYQSIRGQTRRALLLLARSRASLPEELVPQAEEILASEQAVLARLQRLTQTRIPACKIRTHGDYHLGQVLFTGKDFIVIDFEGEPARAVSERRLKRSPLRDAAGMIRSLHYAVHTALASFGSTRSADMAALEPWALPWYRCAAGSFLSTYLDVMDGTGILPPDRPRLCTLLDALLIEKAVYELAYELNNRPGWVGVPLRGIREVLEIEPCPEQ
jgi:maltose alpha-D-glucosyltransferase/alpha-amylase